MTAISGGKWLTISAISPKWLVPSSRTSTSVSSAIASIVRLHPISVLKLLTALCTRDFFFRAAAVSSRVVVLPTLPVIAATFGETRRRYSSASTASALCVSSTAMKLTPEYSAPRTLRRSSSAASTSKSLAPRSIA